MSPASYQTAPPRVKTRKLTVRTGSVNLQRTRFSLSARAFRRREKMMRTRPKVHLASAAPTTISRRHVRRPAHDHRHTQGGWLLVWKSHPPDLLEPQVSDACHDRRRRPCPAPAGSYPDPSG